VLARRPVALSTRVQRRELQEVHQAVSIPFPWRRSFAADNGRRTAAPCGCAAPTSRQTGQPATPETTTSDNSPSHGSDSASTSKKHSWGADRLGLYGMAGFVGNRALLFLGGKKAALGLFSVVSLKKLLFLPAWIWVISVSGGASIMLWFSSLQAPVSHRRQVIVTSPEAEAQLGRDCVRALQGQGMRFAPQSARAARRVTRIGTKLKHALALLEEGSSRQAEWLVRSCQDELCRQIWPGALDQNSDQHAHYDMLRCAEGRLSVPAILRWA
jgi:hypothetical protein